MSSSLTFPFPESGLHGYHLEGPSPLLPFKMAQSGPVTLTIKLEDAGRRPSIASQSRHGPHKLAPCLRRAGRLQLHQSKAWQKGPQGYVPTSGHGSKSKYPSQHPNPTIKQDLQKLCVEFTQSQPKCEKNPFNGFGHPGHPFGLGPFRANETKAMSDLGRAFAVVQLRPGGQGAHGVLCAVKRIGGYADPGNPVDMCGIFMQPPEFFRGAHLFWECVSLFV